MSILTRSFLLLTLILPAAAYAADGSSTMSRNQIEQCLRDRQEVVARNQDLSAQKASLDERGAALLKNESRLKEAQNSLKPDLAQLQTHEDELKRRSGDINSYIPQAMVVKKLSAAYKERVDRYNAEVRAHQVLLDQYNTDADALNVQLAALDAKARSTDERCVKYPAKRSDIDAAKAALEEKPRTVLTPETRVLP
jgi:chromosome segregation ATPase